MGNRLTEIVVDCHDPAAQAAFWAAALGYHVVRTDEGQVDIAPWEREPPDLAERVRRAPGVPALVFVTVPEAKNHLGLRSDVVARDKDHSLAPCLVGIRTEDRDAQGVCGLDDARTTDKAGDKLA